MPIVVECDACGKKYKVDERFAGTSKRCKVCGQAIEIPELAGGPIYRHEARSKPFELAIGDTDSIERIEEHIKAHLGDYDSVLHEIISDLVHIDVHVIKPTDERPWYTLVTSGMSDRPMTVPEEAEVSPYAELLICLPPDWPMDQEAWKDERHYWPIRWLKVLARLPHEYDTWLSYGHTVPNGDPPEPLADDTKLCCLLIAPPVTTPDEFQQLDMGDGKVVNFWAVVPIYEEEVRLKLKQGADPLFDRFDKHGINEVLDIDRVNVCKKKFGLF